MKQYQVLLRNIDGTETTVLIDANNENDARWEGRQREGVFAATVIRRNIPNSKYYINPNSGLDGITSILNHFN